MAKRIKILLTVITTFIALVIVLWVTAHITLMGSFSRLEKQVVEKNVDRVMNALSDELNSLSTTASDYACWDDTHAFIADGNRGYIDSNLVDLTFIQLRLNLMLLIHSSGRVVFGKSFDLKKREAMSVPRT